jgi:type I restriction enzyme S subunit
MSNSEWKEYEMSELIEEISMGPFGSNIKVECFTDSGVPVLNGSNLVGFRLNEDSFNYVTEEKATSLGKANAYRGDIVITHRGTLGQIVYIPQNSKYSRYVISQSQFRVRCNEKVIPEYLVYYFHSRLGQHKLLSNASQVGVPSLARPTSTFQKLTISIPPVAKQKEIVKILSSLDDKIELNNAINRNLEEQAQAIFKNWFVDFEPFGENEFVDSPVELKIPKSLKMVQIDGIPHSLETGRRPKGGAVSEGIPSIGAENVKQLGVFDFSSNKFIPREFAESLGKGKINGYELLLYKDGGKPGTFIPHFSMFGEGFPYEECYINEHVFKLDFGDKGLNIFAYFYFQMDHVVSWLANNGGKAAIPGINQNDVNAIWIYDLNNPKVKEFGNIAKPMFEQILKNCKQNRQLSLLRDSLLPKLMSRELELGV